MGGVRPNTSENGQISLSTTVRAARVDGSRPDLTFVLLEGRKNVKILASSGVIRGILVVCIYSSSSSRNLLAVTLGTILLAACRT